jgi:hypothetical protein
MQRQNLINRIGRRHLGGWALIAVMTVLATGCGYSSKTLYPENIRSVRVEMFQSKEFRRGIEFQLTEALRKQIDRTTPYKNAPKRKADTILSGEVLEWRESTLGRDPITDRPRETAGTIAVRYRWQDLRTGKILVDQPRFVETVTYIRSTGENTYDGLEEATNKIARRIVESLERPW